MDNKLLAFSPAVELSYLTSEQQGWLWAVMDQDECAPSLLQAKRLKKFSAEEKLTEDMVLCVMSEEKPAEARVVLKQDKLSQYFPKSYTPRQMEEVIERLLSDWAKHRQRAQEASR